MKNLRKIALSLAVMFGFAGYIHQLRGDDGIKVPALPTTNTSGQTTGSTTPSTTTTPSISGGDDSSSEDDSGPTGNQTTPTPTNTSANPSPTSGSMMGGQMMGQYRNGSYTGAVADAFYGNVQVRAKISGGKLVDVQFLQYPNDRGHSIEINNYAMPLLTQEAIQAQSANVNGVSGASATSYAFVQSLQSALQQAS